MHDFITTSLIIFLAVLHGRASRMGTLSMVLLRLPSTVMHELAHLVAALVTFAKPDGINIIPRRVDCGWILGSVQCGRLWMLNAFPVGMAPALINLPLAWWIFQRHTTAGYIWAFLLVTAAVPSEQDLRVALSSLVGAGLWIGGLMYAGRYMLWL